MTYSSIELSRTTRATNMYKHQSDIMNLCNSGQAFSVNRLANELDIPWEKAHRYIQRLFATGFLEVNEYPINTASLFTFKDVEHLHKFLSREVRTYTGEPTTAQASQRHIVSRIIELLLVDGALSGTDVYRRLRGDLVISQRSVYRILRWACDFNVLLQNPANLKYDIRGSRESAKQLAEQLVSQ